MTGTHRSLIHTEEVTKVYNPRRPDEVCAVDRVTVGVERGEVVALKGPSGSGKTTLLSLLGCMARPTAGRLKIQGREVNRLPERFLSRIRRESFGFVFQSYNLVSGVSVLENVMLPSYPTALPHQQVRQRALFLLETLEILSKAHLPVQSLSGGEQQRAAIARALINEPEFVIADEPTAHLDTDLAGQFLEIVARLKDQGKTVLMGSHDPVLFNAKVVDRVIEMRYGRVVGEA